MKLTINMRLRMDSCQDHEEVSNFSDLLLRVGEGTDSDILNDFI